MQTDCPASFLRSCWILGERAGTGSEGIATMLGWRRYRGEEGGEGNGAARPSMPLNKPGLPAMNGRLPKLSPGVWEHPCTLVEKCGQGLTYCMEVGASLCQFSARMVPEGRHHANSQITVSSSVFVGRSPTYDPIEVATGRALGLLLNLKIVSPVQRKSQVKRTVCVCRNPLRSPWK